MAAALDALEKRYGWVITYEDPLYLHPDEIADVTRAVRKDYDPSKPKVLVPRGGPFDFGYTVREGVREPEPAALLQALLEDYHVKKNPGVFRLVRTGEAFHVVPAGARNVRGHIEPHGSILDGTISVADGRRSAFEALQGIASAVTSTGGATMQMGTVPLNLLIQRHVQGGATRENARTVLLRTLNATGRKLTWRLFCGPGLDRTCTLNVHIVRDAAVQPQ